MYLRKYNLALLTAALFHLALPAAAQVANPETETKQEGISYGIVVDNSGSFRKLLEDVIGFVGKVLDGQKPADEAFFVRFIDTEKIRLDQEFTSNVNEIRDSTENMYVEAGQKTITDALRVAGNYLADNGKAEYAGRRAILIVTDGEDRASVTKPEHTIKILKDAGIRLVAVVVSDEKVQTKLLDRMTRETGGKLFVLKHKGELRTIGSEVAAALRNP